MCRIYGHFNAAVSAHELRTVAALQRHGGPDGHGSARVGLFSIGSNRLSIMDPSAAEQPYELLGGAVRVVFNGELYNHESLRRHLRGRGYAFSDQCDGSVLPALYLEYGDAFTERLDGMYAVAVLDLREEPRLLLATDHMGMKPLFYRWDERANAVYFASEIPSLLAFDAVSTSDWDTGLNAYLATKTPFGEQTMFADIKVLPPATTAVFETSGPRFVQREDRAECEVRPDTLREALSTEVQRLLIADVAVATITSGGLDSSLVTELAAQVEPDPHTFHIAYHGKWPGDEREYARQAAASAGATYHQVEIDPASFPDLLADVVWHLGQPNADPIALSTYSLFRAVRDAGFKVALTGDAADELFGGYDRMRSAALADAAGRPWLESYLDDIAVLPRSRRFELYTAEFARECMAEESGLPDPALRVLHGAGTALQRITAFEQRYRLPAYHLRRVDHLSMASSVEVRLPFCQPRIAALGAALPDHLRIGDDGQVKRVLYAAAAGLLPAAVLHRPKQPFTLPVAALLSPGTALWEFARDMLASSSLGPAGKLDPVVVQELFAVQAEGPDSTVALTIWALLIYEVWRKQFQSDASRVLAGKEATAA